MTTPMKAFKVKATSLFQGEDKHILESVIKSIHLISQRASFLIKHHYLKCLKEFPNHMLAIDEEFIEKAYDAVRGRIKITRCRKDDKAVLLSIIPNKKGTDVKVAFKITSQYKSLNPLLDDEFILQSYRELFHHEGVSPVDSKNSISHILTYSIKSLATHYETNIESHYPKYIKKFITRSFHDQNVDQTVIRSLTKHILFKSCDCPEGFQDFVTEHFSHLAPYENVFERIYKDTWFAFRDMVILTQKTEPFGKKLLSPFILKKSDIPTHITMDTSGMAQLFYDQQRIEAFTVYYAQKTQKLLVKLKNKANLLSSYKSLLGDPTPEPSEFEAAMYATHLWKFVANFEGAKRYRQALEHVDNQGVNWVFNNSIQTDGVSVTFIMVPKKELKRANCFTRRKNMSAKTKEEKKKEPFESFDATLHSQILKDSTIKCLSGDPGKNNILEVTDGLSTFRYTKKQRDSDCQFSQLAKARRKLLPKDMASYQSEVLGGDGENKASRSCMIERFKQYVYLKLQGQAKRLAEYAKTVFRNLKFKSFCLVKRSEDKMIKKLVETFCKPSEVKASKWMTNCCEQPRCCSHHHWGFKDKHSEDKETMKLILQNAQNQVKPSNLVIFYGNWGRSPHVKHSTPTPGIGLKRKIAKRIKTFDTPEPYSSKTCPGCLQTSAKQVSKQTTQLLRCENVQCQSRWWSRDILGSFNILYKSFRSMVTSRTEGVELQHGHLAVTPTD
jgi:hypothetical protein